MVRLKDQLRDLALIGNVPQPVVGLEVLKVVVREFLINKRKPLRIKLVGWYNHNHMQLQLKGRTVFLDDDKLGVYKSRVWHISDTGYVVWRGIEDGKKRTIRLHRLIAEAKDGEIVDHINRNKLDNRRSNLRICSQRENSLNSDRVENAKGYYFSKSKNRWIIDMKTYGIKSVYVESEQVAKDYVRAVREGREPRKILHRRVHMFKIKDGIGEDIIRMVGEGTPYTHIAKKYSLYPSSVRRYYLKNVEKPTESKK